MKQNWRIAAAYVGGVIGAGFISGQELLRFFARYGPSEGPGLGTVLVGFAVLGGLQMKAAAQIRPVSFRDYLIVICGARLGRMIDTALALFLFAGAGIMISGGGAVLHQLTGWPSLIGNLLMAVTAGFTAASGTEATLRFNGWLSTVIVASLIVLGLQSIGDLTPLPPTPSFTPPWFLPTWWVAAVLYLSYNSVLAVGLFANLGWESPRNGKGPVWAVAGGLILGILSICVSLTLHAAPGNIWSYPIPMLAAVSKYGPLGEKTYALVTWAAMATTAVVDTYALSYRLGGQSRRARQRSTVMVVTLCFPLSFLGFGEMIETVYPFFGYIGLIYLVMLFRFLARPWTCSTGVSYNQSNGAKHTREARKWRNNLKIFPGNWRKRNGS